MGNAHGNTRRAALVAAAQKMGGHPHERVHAAAVVAKTVALADAGEAGLVLPCPQLDDAQHVVLQQVIDAAVEAVRDSTTTLTVALAGATFQLRAEWQSIDNSWQWSAVHHGTPHDAQDAHLVLAGILPSRALADALPWGLVSGFVDTVQEGTVVTPVPALLVPVMLACTLQRGGTVSVGCAQAD